jgi:AtzE family amidohydrolase
MSLDLLGPGSAPEAWAIAQAVQSGHLSARAVIETTLARIQQRDPALNSFTATFPEAALEAAQHIDRAIAQGKSPGALAGVPFAVKNLFDIAGVVTLAGSKINQDHPPAAQDATAIAKLKQAGAILVGALNMDEYAYGFVTENAHYGAVHNPHDLQRIAGGSSGGSAAAVAAGLVPLSLGTDTNGSIRVPAALCGIFGLKPTYGRLSRAGVAFLSTSLDHIGPLARSPQDLALALDCLQGADPRDPVCTARPVDLCLPQLHRGIAGLRIAVAGGYFREGAEPAAIAAVDRIAQVLDVTQTVVLPETVRARAAAYVITASEGGRQHLANLRSRPQDFDPATRDRFLAGALIPNAWYLQAQRFRRWYRDRVRDLFAQVDILLAPTTPCPATPIGQTTTVINGQEMLIRPNLGLYTQPLSFIGLPVLSVPVARPAAPLPLGVQLIAAPNQEAQLLRVAQWLADQGAIASPIPPF